LAGYFNNQLMVSWRASRSGNDLEPIFMDSSSEFSREATKTVDVEAKALRRLSLPQEAELHIDRIIAANNSLLIMWQPPESPLKPFREVFRPHNHGTKPDSEAG
jgi:hypothetical protein